MNRDMKVLPDKLAAIAFLLVVSAPGLTMAQPDKLTLGWVEEVVISRSAFTMNAKLDTGADTSSLDAQDIERFERGGDPWVRFTLSGNNSGESATLERPLERDVLIKRHRGPSQRRPVVRVPVCLGPHLMDIEVSLIDRSHFNYPVLIGRAVLEGVAVVDTARAFTHTPDCEELARDPAGEAPEEPRSGDRPSRPRNPALSSNHAARPPMVE